MEVQRINKNIANVIASGSTGNCEIYHGCIAVDMGVPYSKIEPYKNQVQIVLLTHTHLDHFNINTIKKLSFERPALRFGIGEHMVEFMKDIRNVDVYKIGKLYDYGSFQIKAVALYHDVVNIGYKIYKGDYKIFRATDTAHLDGITAPGFNLFCIESNYDEDTIQESIEAVEAAGGFAYQKGAINSHLSEQQAREFIYRNRCEDSKVVRLHQHV